MENNKPKLLINPIAKKDLESIWDYIAEDNEEYATRLVNEMYTCFEKIQKFPGIGAKLSTRVSFKTNYRYMVFGNYIILYIVDNQTVGICRIVSRYQDITRII